MPSVVGELALDLIKDLILEVVKKGIDYSAQSVFVRRRIENRVEDAVAIVVEPLFPFLTQEHVPEEQQKLLIEVCIVQLEPFAAQPEKLFRGSLDGQKIFQLACAEGIPEAIRDERLEGVYELVLPRIASLLCELPIGVQQWQREGWRENFRRLDELAASIRGVFERVDAMAQKLSALAPTDDADQLLMRARTSGAQKVGIELDITGLRADRPLSCSFDALFVLPSLAAGNTSEHAENQPDRHRLKLPHKVHAALLRKGARTVVVGPPGAGKSTWLKWLHRGCLGEAWMGLPIRLELRRFSKEQLPPVQDIVRQSVGLHMAEELTAARLRHWMDAGHLAFFFDGFDEIVPDYREAVREWILALAAVAPACPIVLTSRPLTTDHLQNLTWRRYEIEPFDQPRVVDYIDRWYRYSQLLSQTDERIDASALARTWEGDPTLGPLTGNPLLLSTLLVVHHLDGKLPSGRAELYRRYVDGMLGGWDDRRKVEATHVKLTTDQKRRLLRDLALRMHLDGQDQVDEGEMLFMLQSFLARLRVDAPAEDVLSTICERSGLLVGPGVYSFAHKSVGEYLVAEAVIEGEHRDDRNNHVDRFRLFGSRHDDRWNTVLFLWAGRAPQREVEEFVAACLEHEGWPDVSVACGLLVDQFHRLPPELRSRALGKVMQAKMPLDTGFYFIYGAPSPGYSHIAIDSPTIRGLRHVPLSELLNEMASSGELAWPPKKRADTGKVAAAIWAAYTHSKTWEQDPVPWMAELPVTINTTEWRVMALSVALISANRDMNAALTLSRLAADRWPHLGGVAPFLLLNHAHMTMTHHWDEDAAARSLSMLKAVAESGLNDSWLRGSAEFRSFVHDQPFDLLQETLDLLRRRAVEGSTMLDIQKIQKASELLEQFITRRKPLLTANSKKKQRRTRKS